MKRLSLPTRFSLRLSVLSWISLIALFLLPGCTKYSIPENWDGGLLTANPCGPPCFLGIQPGITTQDKLLKSDWSAYGFKNCRRITANNTALGPGLFCESLSIRVDEQTKKVGLIRFTLRTPITVEVVISKYGDPNSLATLPPIANYNFWHTFVYFDTIHTWLHLKQEGGATFIISPSTNVEEVGYYPATADKNRQSWHGYGQYP